MYTIHIYEDNFMKKYALILLPVLLTSMVGCKKATVSPVDADFKKVEKLKYDAHYEDKLPEHYLDYATTESVLNQIETQFYTNAIEAKRVRVCYDEMYALPTYNYVETEWGHTVHTLHSDYSSIINGTYRVRREFPGVDRKPVNRERIQYTERYPIPENMELLDHEVTNGNHELTHVNVSHLPNRLHEPHDIPFYDVLDEWINSICIYQVASGYVGYSGERYSYDDEGFDVEYYEQTIFEFDKNCKLIKGTRYYEYKSNRDYTTNTKLSKVKTVYLQQYLFSVKYGERKNKSEILGNIQSLYGKKHFDSASFFENSGDADYNESRTVTEPQYIHIESYLSYDAFHSERIEVTPTVDLYYYSDLTEETSDYSTDKPKVKILTPKKLKYDGSALYFSMDNVNDAVFFEADYKFDKNGDAKYVKGSAKIVNKVEIEDYFAYWAYNHNYLW